MLPKHGWRGRWREGRWRESLRRSTTSISCNDVVLKWDMCCKGQGVDSRPWLPSSGENRGVEKRRRKGKKQKSEGGKSENAHGKRASRVDMARFWAVTRRWRPCPERRGRVPQWIHRGVIRGGKADSESSTRTGVGVPRGCRDGFATRTETGSVGDIMQDWLATDIARAKIKLKQGVGSRIR